MREGMGFIRWLRLRHVRNMGGHEIEAYLGILANKRRATAGDSTSPLAERKRHHLEAT